MKGTNMATQRYQRRMKKKHRTEKTLLIKDCTVIVGDTCRLGECCREVRLGAYPCSVGDILCGYNTLADQYEEWMVIEVSKRKPMRTRVQRIK
jgi:hypothetical protein